MATDDTREEIPPAIVALRDRVDEMRVRVQRMHDELREPSGASAERRAAVNAVGVATAELLEAQGRLRAMRVAHRQQVVAELLDQDRRRDRRRLWQLTGAVAFAGTLVVVLAVAGAIVTARLAIGIPVVLAAVLMAVSMSRTMIRDAGRRAIELRKAVATAVLAGLALIGALAWRPLGYTCLLALGVAAVPLVAALRVRRRRVAGEGGGADRERASAA